VEYYSRNLLRHIQINGLKGKHNMRIAMGKMFNFKAKNCQAMAKKHVLQCIRQNEVTEGVSSPISQ
jgi:hypothetical protein